MKFTSYKQIREATGRELCSIDIDEYSDEEFEQVQRWLIQMKQEFTSADDLINMEDSTVSLLSLDNENILNKVISESPGKFVIDGKQIFGKEIITYPEFSIIKEEGKNNFYRIMHL